MERVDRILDNDCYKKCSAEIKAFETDRRFCGHGIGHCLDVARIMMLLSREEGLEIDRESIYAVALLHDIGRAEQYRTGISHETAGIKIADDILKECGFHTEEIQKLLEAIGHHRDAEIKKEASLSGLLYRADKLSRACYQCEAEKECDWDINKKNMRIQY